MNPWVQLVVTVLITLISSGGFWAYLQKHHTKRNQTDLLMMGLAYKEIVSSGMSFIERGWITAEEYEDYHRFLYAPYLALGGNGVTTRIAAEVANLPIRSRADYAQKIIQEAKVRSQSSDNPYALSTS